MNPMTVSTGKVLRLPAVTEKTGISRSAIYYKITPTSKYFDKTFPAPIRLGANAIGFIESEVDAWIASRAESRGLMQ